MRLLNNIRKAGQRLLDLDERYASLVEKHMGGVHNHPIRVMLGGTPLKGPYENDNTGAAKHLANAMIGGAVATNVGYRYGLPAAGVTLAGKGLYDLATGEEEDRDETLMVSYVR